MSLTIKGRPIRLSLAWLRPPKGSPDGSMSLFEHIAELRYRLVVIALTILVGTIVCWFFRHQLTDVLFYPYEQAKAALLAKNPNADITLVNNGVASPFTLALKVSALAGLLLTAPIWLYQLWAFIVPGLLAKEKKWTLIFLGSATPLFLAGVAVGYYVMPKGLVVLLGFTENGITNLQDVNQFLSFLMRFMLVFGIAFLIPEVVLILNIVGVLKAKYLSKYRSFIIFGTFVFGAVATPSTDPFSMLALALPMTVLFVLAEVIAHVLDRRKARRGTLDPVSRDKALRELSDGESA
ncbi:twin-arginine translocase subunit TatC [Microlunatus flavus]|uniref:Sec-independent protein translocase protein TatC n=1 Tax=Microlunatus flavus TaxID=1036181 RepID=A0A1H9MS35_9ACTN|nr:twin-arginine translocase subunit TatC [Microlunatus flavus]SER26526.1 sec-independent protein translocase protein TatC [Microlunatus flavus]